MKILPPHKISGTLFDIIHGARKELVLVSPYVNLTHWKQLATALTAARDRGVRITFFTRHEPNDSTSKEQVQALGIIPQLVPWLHAKFYFNEKNGLITSLNLLGSSNSNSIEIGSHLETAEELEVLRHFVQQYLIPQKVKKVIPQEVKKVSDEGKYLNAQQFGQTLSEYLEEFVDDSCRVTGSSDKSLSIQALGNSFTIALDGSNHRLVLEGIVSGREAERFRVRRAKHFTSSALQYEVLRGNKGHYDVIQAILNQKLSAYKFNNLTPVEKKQLCAVIAKFLTSVRAFKDDYQ